MLSFDGLAFMLAHYFLKLTMVQTFSGGFIDFLTFWEVLQGNAKTHWIPLFLIESFVLPILFHHSFPYF